jgi:hypothetical protein
MVIFGLAVALGGCATVPPHSLAQAEFQQYRIEGVTVEGVDVIRSWPNEEDTFVKANPVDSETLGRIQTRPASEYPPLKAHLQRVLNDRFRLEFASQVAPLFTGSRPLRAVIQLKRFDVPSVARRVFVDNDAKIQAHITLVDARTGRLFLHYTGPYWTKKLVGGLATGIAVALDRSDVGMSLITDYMTAYRNWLLRN